MAKIEVFLDNTCPFCNRGFHYLLELLPKYPAAEIVWQPIEAHPKEEEPDHHPHVDLAVEGALFLRDAGGDVAGFIKRLYEAHFTRRENLEDINVVSKYAAEVGVDVSAFLAALETGKYTQARIDGNDYAYETKNVWAVPTFICGDKRLDATPGAGVTKEQVDTFLASCV